MLQTARYSLASSREKSARISSDNLQSSLGISGLLDAQFDDSKQQQQQQQPSHVLHVHTDNSRVVGGASDIVGFVRWTVQGDGASRARLKAGDAEATMDAERQGGAWLGGEKLDA